MPSIMVSPDRRSPVGEWLDYLTTLHASRIDLGLQRVNDLVATLGVDRLPATVITVGGTNGKGSCVSLLSSIYHHAGYRVGTYTSPHIHRFNERIAINRQPVTDDLLREALWQVEVARAGRPLSFFEFTTLAALVLFRDAKLDVVVLEVGLGGRLDAVNCVDSDLAIVTSIALDHQEWLGDTREMIAAEKAGIYRANCPAICGERDTPHTLPACASAIGSDLYTLGIDFDIESESDCWVWHGPKSESRSLPKTCIKDSNLACVLMAVNRLQDQRPVSTASLDHAIEAWQLPGRFQRFVTPVNGVYDVAHNPAAATWLASQLARVEQPGDCIAVIAIMPKKAIADILQPLLPFVRRWIAVDLRHEGLAPAETVADHLHALAVPSASIDIASLPDALNAVQQQLGSTPGHVLVTGSFRTVAAVQSHWTVGE